MIRRNRDVSRPNVIQTPPQFATVRTPNLKNKLAHAARVMAPTIVALTFASVAHAQGTMDFSGAQTLMGTFNDRLAYVVISRASDDARIYTNDADTLGQKLAMDNTKKAALALPEQGVNKRDTAAMATGMPSSAVRVPKLPELDLESFGLGL